MRVIHVFSALFQGGAESQLERIIDSSDDSIEHVVVSLKSVETPLVKRLRLKGVRVAMCDIQGAFGFWGILKLRRTIKKLCGPSTVLQCWMYHANFLGWFAAVGLSCPVFWNIRRSLPPAGFTGLISKLCAFTSRFSKVRIFCNSISGIETHKEQGYREDSLIYLPNGFDSNGFVGDSAKCSQIGISENDINLVCVGRYDPIKGHRILIEAFSFQEKVLPRETWDRLKLYFIGREVEYATDIQRALKEFSLGGKVRFLGEREDVKEILPCFDIFCLPSISEGFPNVLVEAMLSGLPCVATDAGDSARILGSEEFVSVPGDPSTMAEKIHRLLMLDESARLSLGKGNRSLVVDRYSIKKTLAQYQSFYQAAIFEMPAS